MGKRPGLKESLQYLRKHISINKHFKKILDTYEEENRDGNNFVAVLNVVNIVHSVMLESEKIRKKNAEKRSS